MLSEGIKRGVIGEIEFKSVKERRAFFFVCGKSQTIDVQSVSEV